jgi:hypothetical protein
LEAVASGKVCYAHLVVSLLDVHLR